MRNYVVYVNNRPTYFYLFECNALHHAQKCKEKGEEVKVFWCEVEDYEIIKIIREILI